MKGDGNRTRETVRYVLCRTWKVPRVGVAHPQRSEKANADSEGSSMLTEDLSCTKPRRAQTWRKAPVAAADALNLAPFRTTSGLYT